MGKIFLVGLGPGSPEQLPPANLKPLRECASVYLRTARHPVAEYLSSAGVEFASFDHLYEAAGDFEGLYEEMVEKLLAAAAKVGVAYAVPGHPLVAESTSSLLFQRAGPRGVEVEVFPAMSCLDALYSVLRLDPTARGTLILDALEVGAESFLSGRDHLILQVYNRRVASLVKLALLERYPADFTIRVVRAAGVAGEERQAEIPLYELDRLSWLDHLASVYIPATSNLVPGQADRFPLDGLVGVMKRLRGENGCPWDKEQDHTTLKPYVVEEAYEVVEAIESGDMHNLSEELGDLLLQVVFHAQLAMEKGVFDINDVVAGITEKMKRRHPHVFGELHVEGAAEVLRNWERIKAGEKEERGSLLDGVPRALPALTRASRLQGKAAAVGFDWPDWRGARQKVDEELRELDEALFNGRKPALEEEVGDLLFSVVNLARLLKLDAESALNGCVEKFIDRFRHMEAEASRKSYQLSDLSLEKMDELWERAKKLKKQDKNSSLESHGGRKYQDQGEI